MLEEILKYATAILLLMIRPPLDELNLQFVKRAKTDGVVKVRGLGLNEDFFGRADDLSGAETEKIELDNNMEIIDDSEEEIPLLSSELTQRTSNSTPLTSQKSSQTPVIQKPDIKDKREKKVKLDPVKEVNTPKKVNKEKTSSKRSSSPDVNINHTVPSSELSEINSLQSNSPEDNIPQDNNPQDINSSDNNPQTDNSQIQKTTLLKPKIRGKKLSDILQTNVRVGLNKKYRIESLHKLKKPLNRP
ncbi:hypothetical protein CLIB1444_03S08284 [[Candida] jaroonii]|uniref:Uncharacterized protein n=1 Tax=[Candida] jaroonii TaxID=467808 RepID=A0ACA9Y691_9ASCO|nr:hypothetical protein CLIB1444_03S08284 [[Candida] jaroonii]